MSNTITVQFGCRSVTREYEYGVTAASLIEDETLQAVLGHGENVRALIAGVEVGPSVEIPSGAIVVLETKANTKGS